MGLDQQRFELRPPPCVPAGRQRPQRVAVIALAPGDDHAALRLPGLDEILSRHLERRLDRFGPAADEIDVIDAVGRVLDQPVGQTLGGFGGEEGRVGVGERVQLPMQRRDHVGMAVAEAGHRGAARGVEIAPALGVDDLEAGTRDGDGQDGICSAMQNVRHNGFTSRGRRTGHPSRPGGQTKWRKGHRRRRHDASSSRSRRTAGARPRPTIRRCRRAPTNWLGPRPNVWNAARR